MIIQHNISSLTAMRNTNKSSKSLNDASAKLSSGFKINKAADDAAGLTISEGMRGQIRGLDRATDNMSNALALIQTADGALDAIHSMLNRGIELSVQAANDTLTAEDRQMIQLEIDELSEEIDYIHYNTEHNTIPVFQDLMPNSTASTLAEEIVYKLATDWVPNAVDAIYNTFPAFNGVGLNIDLSVTSSVQAPYGTIASMGVSYVTSTGQIVTYNLDIDLADITSTSDTAAISGLYYDQVIAHEMMHAAMFATILGMTGTGVTALPGWFVEGSAEAVGGGLTRIQSMSNADIQTQLGTGGITDYQSGYAAVMYMGYLAGGNSMTNIASGLNKIYEELKNPGVDLDQALQTVIVMNQATFENTFKNTGNTAVSNFLDALKATNGAGSVIASSLSTTGENVISNGFMNQTSWIIDISSISYQGDNNGSLWIQGGANSGQGNFLNRFNVSSNALGISNISLNSHQTATAAIEKFQLASEEISRIRSYYGAKFNTYEHGISNNDNSSENLSKAESIIRDTDMAKMMVEYSKNNILQQASQAMLAQSSKNPETILQLLRV